MPVIDTDLLKERLGPGGTWAKAAGQTVARVRGDELKLSVEYLASTTGVSVTTIKRVESGDLVPRDYLRAAIAGTLRKDVADIWPPMTCEAIRSLAAGGLAA